MAKLVPAAVLVLIKAGVHTSARMETSNAETLLALSSLGSVGEYGMWLSIETGVVGTRIPCSG